MTVQPEAEPVEQRQEHHGHQHGRRCYWDLREARWVCAPERDTTTEPPT
jgi:hypothetical protein